MSGPPDRVRHQSFLKWPAFVKYVRHKVRHKVIASILVASGAGGDFEARVGSASAAANLAQASGLKESGWQWGSTDTGTAAAKVGQSWT